MKKQINIQTTESGNKYIMIYEVRVKERETDEVHTYDCFLNKKDAEEAQQFVYDIHHELYSVAYICERMIWC